MSSSGIGPDGKVHCKHVEEAVKRKSRMPKHLNRDFYCCKRPVADKTRCDFFVWADQLPRDSAVGVSAPGPPTAMVTTQLIEQEAGTRGQPVPISPTRQLQRDNSMRNSSSPATPRSAQRLQDIEAGLKQRELEKDLTLVQHPGSSKGPEVSTSVVKAEAIPQPPSPVPTEVDGEVEVQPRKTFSFLGLIDSPQPVVATLIDEGQPSTPKKPRLNPPTEEDPPQRAAGASGLMLTPPQTGHRVGQSDKSRHTFPKACSRKGKERDGVPPACLQDQNELPQIVGNSEEQEELDSLPLFTAAEDTSSTTSASPTIAENVLDYTDGLKERVKALSEYMGSFDITQAVKLFKTMERQKMRHECRDRSQKTRIGELIGEKDKLVAEVSKLKEELQRSEASNRAKDAEIASLRGR